MRHFSFTISTINPHDKILFLSMSIYISFSSYYCNVKGKVKLLEVLAPSGDVEHMLSLCAVLKGGLEANILLGR